MDFLKKNATSSPTFRAFNPELAGPSWLLPVAVVSLTSAAVMDTRRCEGTEEVEEEEVEASLLLMSLGEEEME